MKVLVCGRERFTDRNKIFGELDRIEYERGKFDVVMQFGGSCGGGPDSVVRDWVWEGNEFEQPPRRMLRTFHHDWDNHGPAAHLRTYEKIILSDPPDLVIVFGPEQGPHRPFVRCAEAASIPVVSIAFEGSARAS